MNALLLFWPALTALLAIMQGVLMPAIRKTPPGPEAKRQAFALHYVGTAAYLLPLVLLLVLPNLWPHVAACLLSRALLFDPVLNVAAGDQPFAVGKTALTDQLLRKLSPAKPERLSALLRVGLLAALTAALLLSGCRSGRDVATAGPGATVAATEHSTPAYLPSAPESKTTPAIRPLTPGQTRRLIAAESRAAARVARAQPRTVPLIQGRAAVNAPQAKYVAAAYKPEGPIVQADTGAVVQVAVAAKNAQAAAGDGNVQQRTEAPKRTVWQRVTSLFNGLTSTLCWLLLGAVLLHALGPGLGYGSGWLRRVVSRRRV